MVRGNQDGRSTKGAEKPEKKANGASKTGGNVAEEQKIVEILDAIKNASEANVQELKTIKAADEANRKELASIRKLLAAASTGTRASVMRKQKRAKKLRHVGVYPQHTTRRLIASLSNPICLSAHSFAFYHSNIRR